MNNTTLEIYKTRKEKEIEKRQLTMQIEALDEYLNYLKTTCPHDTVFELADNFPRKIGIITTCYCPACGRIEKIYKTHELEKSSFKNSQIISLKEFNHINQREVLKIIQKEVLNSIIGNNGETSMEELSERIKSKLTPNPVKKKKLLKNYFEN